MAHIHSHAFCYRPPPPSAPPTALILLNSAAPSPPGAPLALLRSVWHFASHRLAADGAASRLFYALLAAAGIPSPPPPGAELVPPALALLTAYLPHAICGDFDSLDGRAAAFYAAQGVQLLPAPEDQDSTDFEKCLAQLERVQAARGGAAFNVVALGPLGGRLDHEAQNLNALLSKRGAFSGLALLSEYSAASALPAGRSLVQVEAPFEGPTCGLLPLCGPTLLTTEGLAWDVKDWLSAFGGRVSTSNRVLRTAEGVVVEASLPMVWTVCVEAGAVVAAAEAAAATKAAANEEAEAAQ